MSEDDHLLDRVGAARLSDRQILERVLRSIDRMETNMSAASDYMNAALESLDTQMRLLQERMSGDAEYLAEQIRLVQEGQADTAALSEAAARVQRTAEVVATLDQPSAVVDEEQPDATAGELPEEPTAPSEPTDPPVDENN